MSEDMQELLHSERIDAIANEIYASFVNRIYARVPFLAKQLGDVEHLGVRTLAERVERIRKEAVNDVILMAYDLASKGRAAYTVALNRAREIFLCDIDGLQRPPDAHYVFHDPHWVRQTEQTFSTLYRHGTKTAVA